MARVSNLVILVNGVESKRCCGCRTIKPVEQFSRRSDRKSGYGSRCKTCFNSDRKIVTSKRSQPPVPFVPRACVACGEVKDENGFIPAFKCRDGRSLTCKWCQYLWLEHRMSATDYQKLFDAQLGLCAICLDPMTTANVDHDHSCCPRRRSCGKCVRGLLCGSCNRGIGLLKDSSKVLLAAANYLEKGGESDR